MMWGLLFSAMYIFAFVAAYICAKKLWRFGFIRKLAKDDKKRGLFIGLGVMAAVFIVLLICIGTTNAVIVFLHLLVFWPIFDGFWKLLERATKKQAKRYYSGVIAIVFTTIYLCIGAYLDFNVWKTEYDITTDKNVGNIKVAMIADSHVGTTFDGEGFGAHLERIQAENPDVLIVSGDFVDDGTSKEDMFKACEALGKVKTTYGVYLVFGNHDKGYYSSRSYTGQDIIDELKKNGVHVLFDEYVLIDDRFYIVGRKDKSNKDRKAIKDITDVLDKSKYIIVADHQPKEYAEEEKAQSDLVLSGHTHGGQLFPVNIVTDIADADDKVYGHEQRGNTNYIVTSGISDWEIIFKTCCYSEYVIVNIHGNN